MVSRIAAFVIWAAVAASIVFWALRLWAQPMAVPAYATVVAVDGGLNGNLDRLLGVDIVAAAPTVAGPAPADPRFRLIGVVAPRAASAQAEGLALIALDDKPARAYRVGAVVEGEIVLQAVHSRGASLGPRGQAAQFDLALPVLPPPATGVPASMGGLAVPMPARPLPPPVPQAPPVEQAIQPEPPMRQPELSDEPSPAERPMDLPPNSAGRARPL